MKLRYLFISWLVILSLHLAYAGATIYTTDIEYTFWAYNNTLDFQMDSQANFLYDYPTSRNGSADSLSKIFWYDWKLAFISTHWTDRLQWVFTKICKLQTDNQNYSGSIMDWRWDYWWWNMYLACNSDTRVDIQEFYENTNNLVSISFYWADYSSFKRSYCFNYDNNISYCVLTNLRKSDAWPNEYSWMNFGTFTNWASILDYVSPYPNSPFTWWPWWWWWSSWWDIVELESAYNVSEVLNAYWEMWYTNNLCYWNFSLDDLAVSWSTQQFFEQDLEDWVYFTWATIFDLYSVYSWWYNFNTFMNSWLARFYSSYTNDISLWFIWYSKALWYNQYLIYIHRPTIQNFSYQNLYNFCYLSVAINNWSVSLDDNFNISMINNWSLPSSVEEELESPWSVLVPWTWSIFNWSWFVPWSWWAWGGGRSRGEWEEPSDAYWLFARLFDYISWLSDAVDLWLTRKWFLPSVIQFWFLVALLYYILKR